MPRRVLITGATGFLGRHLLEQMTTRDDFAPIALLRDVATWREYAWTDDVLPTELVEGELHEAPALAEAGHFDGVTTIFHLAGLVHHSRHDPAPMFQTNVEGTLAVVRAAASMGARVIFISTSGTVGCSDGPGSQADEDSPYCEDVISKWPYYVSKVEAEKKARKLADELGVELVIVRPPILLGPGDHRFRSTGMVLKALRGKLPAMPNGKADFTDIRDVATALLALADHDAPRPVYHTPGTSCRVADLLKMVCDASDARRPTTAVPTWLLWGVCDANRRLKVRFPKAPTPNLPDPVYIEMAAHYWDCTSLYVEDDLGFQPRPPQETVRDTIDWLRENSPALAALNEEQKAFNT